MTSSEAQWAHQAIQSLIGKSIANLAPEILFLGRNFDASPPVQLIEPTSKIADASPTPSVTVPSCAQTVVTSQAHLGIQLLRIFMM